MAQTIPLVRPVQDRMAERAAVRAPSVPWYIWSSIVAVMSGAFGGTWDISWHESIGRDTFWTAAHVMIYLCGVLGGLTAGYLILSTTFQKNSPLRDASISMWGFRGSLGAFVCAWGGVAMITSAPFDNWWHSAYGLDVKILSPPHTLLALGMTGIRFGALLMILAEMNRAQGEYRAKLERVLLFASLFLLGMTLGMAQELTHRFFMHGAKFYLVVMIAAPIWMAAIAWATKHRWAATLMTGTYTALHLAFCWLLPLVPAEPKLGPVYQKITHLVPPDFPLLLIVSAVVFDLVRRRIGNWGRWAQAGALGGIFRELPCRAVAVREFSDVPGRRQLGFRHPQLPLPCAKHITMGAQCICSHGADRRWVLHNHGAGAWGRGVDDSRRHRLGRLDAPSEEITPRFL
jgi:hypothetical protein